MLACCVVGDGEAETGALATSWHSNKFLNPVRDGAVIPILHLNGCKIAGPTVLARIGKEELAQLLMGYGYEPYFVEGGLVALAFTAGIGENCPSLRETVCRRFGFLGLRVGPEKNSRSPVDADITAADSLVRVLVIHTEEDWEIMRECYRLAQTGLLRISRG